MYKATITDKKVVNGMLTVSVLFENPETNERFEDTIQTAQAQDSAWIGTQIETRLYNLRSVPSLHEQIKLGEYVKPQSEIDRVEYVDNSRVYLRYMDAARQGFIPSDYHKILELREWLRTNFKDEYITYL